MFTEIGYDKTDYAGKKQVVRYDGTRFITENEIDKEFTDKWVLIRTTGEPNLHSGFLVASAEGNNELYSVLTDIAVLELNAKAKIIYGCKTRGDNLHVQLHG